MVEIIQYCKNCHLKLNFTNLKRNQEKGANKKEGNGQNKAGFLQKS